MKSKRLRLSGWLLVLVAVMVVMALALIAPGMANNSAAQAKSEGPTVLNVPPALTAKWWQWALETPLDENGNHPLLTSDAATWDECGEGQSGKVWFLGGTYDESGIEARECTIPEKKRILFPLVNVEVDSHDLGFNEFFCGTTEADVKTLKECVQFLADHMTAVTASVDGQDLVASNMDAFRVLSPPFKFDLPENAVNGQGPAEDVRGISDGFWVLLAPLPAGEHTITLGGTFTFDENQGDPATFQFSTEVTYYVTIE